MATSHVVVVVPCYNEAARLDVQGFEAFARAHANVTLLFVDDGSTDATLETLERLRQSCPDRVQVYPMPRNRGKAEAVRHGLLRACEARPDYVGFWDADLATPLEEIGALMDVLDNRPEIEMVFGVRVNLLGRSVRRSLARHYAGRVFATAAALVLGMEIYDTQCGAKLFRVSDGFVRRLQEPFIGGWIFDVEIIAREVRARRGTDLPPAATVIYEYPLLSWRDVGASKLKPRDWFVAGASLARIYVRYIWRTGS